MSVEDAAQAEVPLMFVSFPSAKVTNTGDCLIDITNTGDCLIEITNTGDCLIEIPTWAGTTWAGLTVHVFVFYLF
jgi:hypothetical protein